MHWHWLIVIYLFLGGLGAGAYLTSFAAGLGWLGKNSNLSRTGYYIAPVVVAFGTILLVFDLGQGLTKPWLLVRLLLNFGSVMTWGTYILSVFILVGLVVAFLALKKKQIPSALGWLGALLAIATGTYTGLLVSVVEAVPMWNTMIMPVLFVVSALSTGLSVTSLFAHFIEKEGSSNPQEGKAHLILVALELVVAGALAGTLLSGANGPVGVESVSLTIFGDLSVLFWGYFVGLGLLLPLLVFGVQVMQGSKVKQVATSTGKALNETAAITEKAHHSNLTLVTDVSVLVGGFALRALIIFAALPIWDGTIL